jgi:hypothetical protein
MGTTLAKDAKTIPGKGMVQADSNISRVMAEIKSKHDSNGRTGMRRKVLCSSSQ